MNADPAPDDKPRRVFFAFDFRDEATKNWVVGLPDAYRRGELDFEPSMSLGGQGDLWHRVESDIRAADAVCALVDHANANVAFEYGFALGLGRVGYLGQSRAAEPAWIAGPPFKNLLRAAASKRSEVEALVGRDGARVDGTATAGARTLFLCPDENIGEDLLRFAGELEDWEVPDATGWNLARMGPVLANCWRVVWVVLPFDQTVTDRHGKANAAHAAVAGFARARGLELRVYRSRAATEIVDVGVEAIEFSNEAEFRNLVDGLEQRDDTEHRARVIARLNDGPGDTTVDGDDPTSTSQDPLVTYRSWVRTTHATTVPFFGTTARALKDVFVGLAIRLDDRFAVEVRGRAEADAAMLEHKDVAGSARLKLAELMALPAHKALGLTRRWVLLGDPGSGKSTIAKRVACELAEEDDGPLPLFVSLARLASSESSRDPFALVAADVAKARDVDPTALADALRERARADAVWFLLDGLDEVHERDAGQVPALLGNLQDEYEGCPIVVTSRRTGYGHAPHERFVEAELLPLDATAQHQLLENWLGAAAAELAEERIRRSPRLVELASNPFLLTLLAELSRSDVPLPPTRGKLYEQAVQLLLRRGCAPGSKGMGSPEAAEELLAPISLALQERGGESWSRPEVYAVLVDVVTADDRLAKLLKLDWPAGTGEFLDAVARDAGVLGPHDGPSAPWRYLHRSLREYLAAKALAARAERGELDVDALVGYLADEEGRRRWGETVAILVAMLDRDSPARRDLLRAVVTRDRDLAHRTLPQLEGLDPAEALELLEQVPEGQFHKGRWDGDDLAAVLRSLRLDGADCAELHRQVAAPIDGSMATEALAQRVYALESAGVCDDALDLLERAGRKARADADDRPDTVPIPVNGADSITFTMGSPEGVGSDDERPRRSVTLSPYRIGRTPVTQEQFARFDGRGVEHPKRPVVGVSWWEVWLYCRWLGGRLPTEAEWECAARARSDDRWCFGNDEARLREYAWYGENSKSELHDVATREANSWGLFDLHGNVWEWCSDWYGDYDESQVADPSGPADGAGRVLRGGSFWDDADGCRSAFRLGVWPWWRNGYVGFRVVLPSS